MSKRIRARSSTFWTWMSFSAVAVLALFVPGFLHAKADYFSSVDPDFLSRFGDLHPDWQPDPEVLKADNCQCCNTCNEGCGGCNNCCDGCGDGCRDCCDRCTDCNCRCDCKKGCNIDKGACVAVLVFAVIVSLVFYAALAIAAFYVIRLLLHALWPDRFAKPGRPSFRRRRRHSQHFDQQQAPTDGPLNSSFRKALNFPGHSRAELLDKAHNWFAEQYPELQPQQIVSQPAHSILQAKAEIPIVGRVQATGEALDFGKVDFTVELAVKDETAQLKFKEFTHNGSAQMPSGGKLSNPGPDTLGGNMTEAAWKMIKQTVANKIRVKLTEFPQTFGQDPFETIV
ncbi:MAG: DUF4468 domain-containing protein [Bacteroidota bacterium]